MAWALLLRVVGYMWLTHLHLQRCTQTNSICVRMSGRHVENPSPLSEEVSSPSQRLYDILRSFICQAVASAASCKQVAWTGCTENCVAKYRAALSALHQTEKALQEATNQEPLHTNKYDRNSAAHYLTSNV